MYTEKTPDKILLKNLRTNQSDAYDVLESFMQELEDGQPLDNLDTDTESGSPAFIIEGVDDDLGINIQSDKYHIYLSAQPSTHVNGGSLLVCFGKTVGDGVGFNIQQHWITTLHLSNDGFISFKADPSQFEAGELPDIITLPIEMIFNANWGGYLFSLAKAGIKMREDHQAMLESLDPSPTKTEGV